MTPIRLTVQPSDSMSPHVWLRSNRATCGLAAGQLVVQVLLSGIKKPACGRLLGDWLGLFLVNRASLQNVHPDLASGCGTWRESHLPCRCDPSLKKGRSANVGRSILIFLRNSQFGMRGRAIVLRCSSGRTQALPAATGYCSLQEGHRRPAFIERRPPEYPSQYPYILLVDLLGIEDLIWIFGFVIAA